MHTEPFSRDRFMMLPRQLGAEAAYEVLHPIQSLSPEQMVMGVAILFAAVCSRIGLEPHEAYCTGLKVLHADDPMSRTNATLQSLRDFAGLRIAGDQSVSIS